MSSAAFSTACENERVSRLVHVCRSYGVVSELDDRLAKVEAALYAKLDSAGYVETSLIELEADLDEEDVKPDVTCVSSARPRARNCAEDPVATISAAFDFAASFLPPNPATYGQYVTGLTGAGPGREHLRAVLDQHEAELFALDPLSAGPAVPQEAVLDSLNWRRTSVALSSSSSSSSRGSLSDCAVPDTPMTSVHGSPPRQRLRSLAEDTISSSRSKHKPMISLRKGEAELGQMFPLGSLPPPLLPPPPTPPPCAFPHCVDPFADISYQASPPAPQGFRPFNFQPIPDPAQSPALFLLPPPPVFPSATHSTPFHSRAHPAGLPAALPPPSIPLLPPFRYAF